MSKKIDRKITIKPKDIPNIDREEVGDYYNKIWRVLALQNLKRVKVVIKERTNIKGDGKID